MKKILYDLYNNYPSTMSLNQSVDIQWERNVGKERSTLIRPFAVEWLLFLTVIPDVLYILTAIR